MNKITALIYLALAAMAVTVAAVNADARTNDSSFLRAKARWQAWVATRPAPCDPSMDSVAYFNPQAKKVAIVFHGVGSGPAGMMEMISTLRAQGYSVLAPRLAGHFDVNLRDLDSVNASDWVRDSEQVFAIARGLGPQVTVVGYSLGGLLASRLAIRYADYVDRAVLIAPAWRMNPTASLGSVLGSILHKSLNEYRNTPISCRIDEGYVPARAGSQIERLMMDTEAEFGATYSTTRVTSSIFARMIVPHLVILSTNDEAIDAAAIHSMCGWSQRCEEVTCPGAGHTTIQRRMGRTAGGSHQGQTLNTVVVRFLNQR